MLRVVLDTNQLVAALMRPPELATLLMSGEAHRFTVIASPDLIDEYQYVLAYPKIANSIAQPLLRTFQSHLLTKIEIVYPAETPQVCRDPDDDKVIAAAIYGFADAIVTVDKDLLTREIVATLQELGIQVISGAKLLNLLDKAR